MGKRFQSVWVGLGLGVLALALAVGLGCASFSAGPFLYSYFEQPAFDDAWSAKIEGWQRRERADNVVPSQQTVVRSPVLAAASAPPRGSEPAGAPPDEGVDAPISPGDLRGKYARFLAERKRQLARDVASWIQSESRNHYLPDGPVDHWATLEETLSANGDDCDGLELLAFHALRDLGFGSHEVYRAIVVRPEDGQHHMVTLWFETPDDPWVIDPTGAMTLGMPRMTEMPEWVPLKVFTDTAEYTATPARDGRGFSSLAVNP